MFVRSCMEFTTKFFTELGESFSSGVYITNHSPESIHIWTIGTLEGRLSFHDSWRQGPCPQGGARGQNVWYFSVMETTYADSWSDMAQSVVMQWKSAWPIFYGPVILPYILKTIWCMNSILRDYGSVWPVIWPKINVGHCDLYFIVQWFCLISRMYIILWDYNPRFYLKINIGHCDLYFMVQWFCLVSWTIWCMNIILRDYGSVWPDIWPQNKCSSLWPTFHGPVILPYTLKTFWCMHIILWDYELVWPEVWPQNKCMSLWPIFYGPVILPCILKTIWCMNIIIWDYDSVWPDVWPQNKYRSLLLYFMGQWFYLISLS